MVLIYLDKKILQQVLAFLTLIANLVVKYLAALRRFWIKSLWRGDEGEREKGGERSSDDDRFVFKWTTVFWNNKISFGKGWNKNGGVVGFGKVFGNCMKTELLYCWKGNEKRDVASNGQTLYAFSLEERKRRRVDVKMMMTIEGRRERRERRREEDDWSGKERERRVRRTHSRSERTGYF